MGIVESKIEQIDERRKKKRNMLIALVHIGSTKIGWDRKGYEEFLFNITGKVSCRQMEVYELQQVVQRLKEAGVLKDKPKKYDKFGDRGEMASPAMLRKIEFLWSEICYSSRPDVSLRKFVFKVAKVSDISFLTKQKASQVLYVINRIWREHGGR